MKTNERLQNSFRTMSMGYIGEKGKRECEAENEAIRMAIAALEKQIHKRPKFDVQKNYVQGYEVEDTYVHCPVCGYRFYSIVNGEECAGRKTPCCPIFLTGRRCQRSCQDCLLEWLKEEVQEEVHEDV